MYKYKLINTRTVGMAVAMVATTAAFAPATTPSVSSKEKNQK